MKHIYVIAVVLLLTACNSRVWCSLAMCTDQTGLQMDYVTDRDQCRQLANLKAGMDTQDDEQPDASQKSKLVTLYSECMKQKNWDIPSGDEKKAAAAGGAAAPQYPYGVEPVASAPASTVAKARASRAGECAFARQEAPFSLAAKQRADACDLECANQQRVAPEAPKAPSCP